MPTSLNASSKPSRFQNELNKSGKEVQAATEDEENSSYGLHLSFGKLSLLLEPRFIIVALLIAPLYVLAAFVGNEWAYMLPCTLLAALVIGITLPLMEVLSIVCSCQISAKTAYGEQEICLKARRLPLFGLLSQLIPSGYLGARLHLTRRNWSGASRIPAVLPLPVVLESLSRGMELRLPAPSLGRGVYEVESLEIASCFPFALAWWSRRIELADAKEESSSITVLPERKELAGAFHPRLTDMSINTGRNQRNWLYQSRSTNLKGLREFTERDSLSQIHWASSARSGKFMVREFEVESLPDFDVLLDLTQAWNPAQFDLACSSAYALVHYGTRLGFAPQLKLKPSLDWQPLADLVSDIPAGSAGEELAAEILARILPLPAELLKDYREFEETRKDTGSALNLSAELSANNARNTVVLMPADERRNSKSVALFELNGNLNLNSLNLGTRLGQLESEAELNRL